MTDPKQMIIDLSEGNPGAITVLMKVMVARPDLLLYMYENGPRGSDIWVLYKDECDEDIYLFMDMLSVRAEIEEMEEASGV